MHQSNNQQKQSNATFYGMAALLLLVAFAYLLPVSFVFRENFLDQGLLPTGADMLVRGKLLYRDMFLVEWPGSYFIMAAVFKLFGPTWLASRVLLLLTFLSLTLVMLALARKLVRGKLAFLPAFIFFVVGPPLWSHNSLHWDTLLGFLLTNYCLACILAAEKRSPVLTLTAGVCGGMSILCNQVSGPAIAVGFLTASALEAKSRQSPRSGLILFAMLGAGASLVLFSWFAYLFATGTFEPMLEGTIGFALADYGSTNSVPFGYSRFLESQMVPPDINQRSLLTVILAVIFGCLVRLPLFFIKFAPFILIACIVFAAAVNTKTSSRTYDLSNKIFLLFLATGFTYWFFALHRPDIFHLFWGGQLLLVPLFFLAEQFLRKKSALRFAVALTTVILIPAIFTYGAATVLLYSSGLHEVPTRRGPVLTKDDLGIIDAIDQVRQPHQELLVYPYLPILYFLTKTDFAGRYPYLQYRYHSHDRIQSVINYLEQNKVDYVVWDLAQGNDAYPLLGFPRYQPLPKKDLIMENYLCDNYDFVKVYSHYRLMKRKNP